MNECTRVLERHAMLHAPAIGGVDFTLHHLIASLDARQMRARPADLNPIAWIVWHIARVEDGCIAGTVLGEAPLLDASWIARLGVEERGDGEGMTREAAAALGASIDLEALHAYRDAVGRRTRTLLPTLAASAWDAPLSEDEIQDRIARGFVPADEAAHLARFTRASLIWWWAVEHTHYHLGQIAMIRGLLPKDETA